MDESLILRGGIALTAAGAEILIQVGKRSADAAGIPMCIAVVDAGGHLLAFARNDNARLANIQMAITKAVSAVTRRRATAEELTIRKDDPTHPIRTALAAGTDRVTSLSGGLPIFVEGQLVGGIGVSGGRGNEDIDVALAAITSLRADTNS